MDKFNMTGLRARTSSNGRFIKEPAEVRFWRAVDRKSDSECWHWLGAKHYKGYGEFTDSKRIKVKCHRFSLSLKIGEIPNGMMVCHKCDNPICCNPSHLFLGTAKTNKGDCINKNRHAYGVKNGTAKLDPEKVTKIRELDKSGMVRLKIAKMFGISGRSVTAICRHESWKSVA